MNYSHDIDISMKGRELKVYPGAPRPVDRIVMEKLETNMNDRHERAAQVNKLIHEIANCGRRFFYNKNTDCYAMIEVDARGRVWWIDDFTEKRIYTHYRYWGKGFSHGGTLRSLVDNFRDYITKGTQVPSHSFGPWPDWCCGGDLWGYGEDMQKVRVAAIRHGIIST